MSETKITITKHEEMQIHTKVKLLILEWFPLTLKTLITCKGKIVSNSLFFTNPLLSHYEKLQFNRKEAFLVNLLLKCNIVK